MPNLDAITTLINASLKAGNFKSRRFQAAKYYEIAEPIKTVDDSGENISQYVIDNNGEGEEVVYDDTFPFIVFHRRDSVEYQLADLDYGKPGTTMTEVANMHMIFMGSRMKMKVTTGNILAALAIDFPKEFASSVITPLGMNRCVIDTGNANTDPYSNWSAEFGNIPFSGATDTVMISLPYKIISDYNKACFTLCP